MSWIDNQADERRSGGYHGKKFDIRCYISAAKSLGYNEKCIEALWECKTSNEASRVMTNARKGYYNEKK